MNNHTAFLVLVKDSFNDLTEFENGKPQPVNDPMFGMWLNSLKNPSGTSLDLSDVETQDFIKLFLQKRQTQEGIEEIKIIIDERLSQLHDTKTS